MEKTNRQISFEHAYKDIHCIEDMEELLYKFKAEVEYNDEVELFEVYLPSINDRSQAVIFFVEACGFETET